MTSEERIEVLEKTAVKLVEEMYKQEFWLRPLPPAPQLPPLVTGKTINPYYSSGIRSWVIDYSYQCLCGITTSSVNENVKPTEQTPIIRFVKCPSCGKDLRVGLRIDF